MVEDITAEAGGNKIFSPHFSICMGLPSLKYGFEDRPFT